MENESILTLVYKRRKEIYNEFFFSFFIASIYFIVSEIGESLETETIYVFEIIWYGYNKEKNLSAKLASCRLNLGVF